MNEAANDSARVSGQDRKKPPALGTNQIAGFGGFRPLASLEKNKCDYRHFILVDAKAANFIGRRQLFLFSNMIFAPKYLGTL